MDTIYSFCHCIVNESLQICVRGHTNKLLFLVLEIALVNRWRNKPDPPFFAFMVNFCTFFLVCVFQSRNGIQKSLCYFSSFTSVTPCLYSCTSLFLHSEIQSLQDEVPELKNRLQKAEADLVKVIEGEKKVSEEVC